MTKSNYRAAIVGLGFIGAGDQVSGDALGQQVAHLDGTHFAALSGHPRVEVTAGSSRDEGRRHRFAARAPAARTFADWREMLASERFDIVSVATYAPQHAEMVIACAERGVPVIYCEKPLATRLSDADRMLAACHASGSLLVVNHNRRYNPMYLRLREFVAGEGLGDLTSASLQWGTGRLGNVGTHMFDAVRLVTSREIVAVSGTLDPAGKPDCRGASFHDPGGWGVLRLEGGVHVTVDASDMGRVAPRIELNGTQGRATTGVDKVLVEFWDGTSETWPGPGPSPSGMDRAVASIVEHLDGVRAFPWSPEESVRTLEAIVGFHVSDAERSAWISLPLSGPDRDREVESG